ncbi:MULTISPECIES: hypothetical protein [unclassified Methanobrevibacter]|uniref:hypothetical protein n=1 Tax=unclassified Methanobrevibacter TaxID=2638681 RepID=UPI002736DF86|nr:MULTISPECIES: hypothetical protein [unclassified Methanobrevibacter]
MPTTSGAYLSDLLDMSLSLPSLVAQNKMIAIGKSEAKIKDITSKTMNLDKSNPLLVKDKVREIIKNNGMQIIGGFVSVEII